MSSSCKSYTKTSPGAKINCDVWEAEIVWILHLELVSEVVANPRVPFQPRLRLLQWARNRLAHHQPKEHTYVGT